MEEGVTSGSAVGAAITNTATEVEQPAVTEVGVSKTLEAAAATLAQNEAGVSKTLEAAAETCEQTKALTKFGPMLKKLAMEISMVEMQP